MGLLRDIDLVENHNSVQPFVEKIKFPGDPYDKDSAIQACSIDLHIGAIYLPGTKEKEPGQPSTKTDHVLRTGETAVVTTREKVRLPANVAAFGFPPSSVSFKGLLMTNPGHVDPGYVGRLRFTVINMAKDPFSLRAGDRIVRLLFFRLDGNVHKAWDERNEPELTATSPLQSPLGMFENPDPEQSEVNRLSKDFVNVEQRAKRIAKAQGAAWSLAITAAVTLLVGFFQLVGSGHLFGNKEIEELKKKHEALEKRVDSDQKFLDFEKKLSDLDRELQSMKKGREGNH
jgi:deoxycytidine triphosphate deaminase